MVEQVEKAIIENLKPLFHLRWPFRRTVDIYFDAHGRDQCEVVRRHDSTEPEELVNAVGENETVGLI